MFVIDNFFSALASVISLVLQLYMVAIIARAVMSWFNPNPYNGFVRFIHQITEPVLEKVRRYMPDLGGFDLSPIVVILAIYFLNSFLVPTLRALAH